MNPKNPKDIDGAEISWFAPLCDGDDDFQSFAEEGVDCGGGGGTAAGGSKSGAAILRRARRAHMRRPTLALV